MRATISRRRLSTAALVMTGALMAAAAPAGAQTADPWTPCTGFAGFQCSSLTVPLDGSGTVPGTVILQTSRVVAASNPTNTAVVGLAGGPGQAALPLREDFATVMKSAIATRDLLIFDQRGTGESGSLQCLSIRSAITLLKAVTGCANELGPARGFYRTSDSVADIEAMRVAYGYDKLVLFGVSYGTKVAEAYASTYPEHTEALVLDSVVLPNGPDVFRQSSMKASTRIIRELCSDGACRLATPTASTDFKRLVKRLDAHKLSGKVISSSGRRENASISQAGLLGILLAGDVNPTLRAELPGSIRAALRGDEAPLLRLAARSVGITSRAQSSADDGNEVLYLATTCEEAPFPWTRSAGVQQRSFEAAKAASEIPSANRGPFSTLTALEAGPVQVCIGWPDASAAPAATPPLPNVPTLVLSGQMDLRTPLEDAVQIKAQVPDAVISEIPFTGHSVLTSDRSTCAATSVSSFFAATAVPACTADTNPYSPTPRPPSSLGSMSTIVYGGRIGRGLSAIRATITDARRQVIGEVLAQGVLPARIGGLRGGTVAPRVSGSTLIIKLNGYQYVPGVSISGTFSSSSGGTVTIRAARLTGRVHVTPRGAVSGVINGRKVAIVRASSLESDGLPSITSALRTGRLR